MSYILVIDDEADLGELLLNILSEEGYEVRSATTAAEALTLVTESDPSLILFDINLPDLKGLDFVHAYRQLSPARAGLVAISGVVNLAEEAARIGADGYIVKPFEIDELFDTIASTRK
jgi:two-component system, NtrC family, nitrogen regulation response regulator NtrX